MGDLKQLTLWVFHCPVEYREAIQAALPGVLVGFPAANRSIMDQAHRIQAQDGHILGLWEGSAPVDYDIFSAQTGIAAVNIHPISLLNETLSPVTCIGFRVEPLENIADDHPLLSRIVATRQEGHQVLSSIPDGEQCIYGDDYLTRMLPPTQTSRPRLLVVPSAAWVAEHAHFGAVLVTRLCAAVAQAYGATSEVWLNCAHQDLDFIEPLRSGDIDVHI